MGSRYTLLLVAIAALSVMLGSSSMPLLGGWSPIENVNDTEVQEIAKFAVAEYNRQSGDGTLVYVRTLSGEAQVVAGLNYRLRIVAKPSDEDRVTHTYQAVVFDQSWTSTRNLTSFKLIA